MPDIDPGRPFYWLVGFVRGWLQSVRTARDERRREAIVHWKHQWQDWVRQMASAHVGPAGSDFADPPSIAPLRALLVGRSRGDIVSILGPPPATSTQPLPAPYGAYWHADVWYYPIDVVRRRAVAVSFLRETVQSVELLLGPTRV